MKHLFYFLFLFLSCKGWSQVIQPNGISCSHESGVYTEDFVVSLGTSNTNAVIRYTLNSETPSAKSQAYDSGIQISQQLTKNYKSHTIPTTPLDGKWEDFEWKQASQVNKAVIVRFALFDGEARLSPVYTKTYFWDAQLDYSFPVVSVVTDSHNLFAYDTGIYVPGKTYDQSSDVWNPFGNYRNRGEEWEREVHFSFFDTQQNLVVETDAGMRMKGVGSTSFPQKSFTVYFRKEYGQNKIYYPFFGTNSVLPYKRLIFRNGGNDFLHTHFRDAYMQGLLSDMDLETQKSKPSVVFINGEYWGIHNIREKHDKHYFEARFGIEEDNLNILSHCGIIDEGSNSDYNALVQYIETHDVEDSLVYAAVSKEIDVLNFMDYHIAELYFANYDWPCNNVKMWKTNDLDAKWRYLVYDLDYSFGESEHSLHNTASLEHSLSEGEIWPHCTCANLVFRNLLKNETFKKQFISRFLYHLTHTFAVSKMQEALDDYESVYEKEMQEHIYRWGYPNSMDAWKYEIERMRVFAQYRSCYVVRNLEDYFGVNLQYTCDELPERKDQKNRLKIYPNPVENGKIKVEYEGYFAGSKYTLQNDLGQVVQTGTLLTYPVHIEMSSLVQGVYVLSIHSEERIHTGKLVVLN